LINQANSYNIVNSVSPGSSTILGNVPTSSDLFLPSIGLVASAVPANLNQAANNQAQQSQLLTLNNNCPSTVNHNQVGSVKTISPPPIFHNQQSSPSTMAASGHMGMQPTADYLAQLIKDRKQLAAFPNVFIHLERLLDDEIARVRANLFHGNGEKKPMILPDAEGQLLQRSEKVYVPCKEHPEFNFVGRILGPRGMTAKQLEQETGCKIMVRGRGSMRDKKKEESNRGKPNWEHLNDELHVLITVEDTPNRAAVKIARAVEEVNKLLVPVTDGEDELKKRQLMELAIINGTYRDSSARTGGDNESARLMASPISMQMPRGAASMGAPLILSSPRHILSQHPLMNGSPAQPPTLIHSDSSLLYAPSFEAYHHFAAMAAHQQMMAESYPNTTNHLTAPSDSIVAGSVQLMQMR
jgi:protein quaking